MENHIFKRISRIILIFLGFFIGLQISQRYIWIFVWNYIGSFDVKKGVLLIVFFLMMFVLSLPLMHHFESKRSRKSYYELNLQYGSGNGYHLPNDKLDSIEIQRRRIELKFIEHRLAQVKTLLETDQQTLKKKQEEIVALELQLEKLMKQSNRIKIKNIIQTNMVNLLIGIVGGIVANIIYNYFLIIGK